MENLISEKMKTKTMVNREKRIERIKDEIEKLEIQLEEQKEILKEEQTRAIEKSVNDLNRTLSVDDSNLTLDEIIEFIDFVNNDKKLTLEETKDLLSKMKPKEEQPENHNKYSHTHN